MRAKDMQAGTAYATCDGQYVVPEGDPTKKWARYSEKDPKGIGYIEKFESVDAVDPWGGCNTQTPTNNPKRRYSTSTYSGMLVKQFEVDKDGNPIGKGDKTLVRPTDVKGTWAEYMTLYAEKVRQAGEEKERRQALIKLRDELTKLLRPKGFRVNEYPYLLTGYDNMDAKKMARENQGYLFFQAGEKHYIEVGIHLGKLSEVGRFPFGAVDRIAKKLGLVRVQ